MSQASTSHSRFKAVLKGLTQEKAIEVTNAMMTEFKKAISTKKHQFSKLTLLKKS